MLPAIAGSATCGWHGRHARRSAARLRTVVGWFAVLIVAGLPLDPGRLTAPCGADAFVEFAPRHFAR